MYRRLSQLLSPLPPEAFFENFRNRTHLYISRNVPGFYDAVVSMEDLDASLQSELLPATFLNVVDYGVRRPIEEWSRPRVMGKGLTSSRQLPVAVGVPERLFELYANGSTIILNSSDSTIAHLRRTCRELTRELGHSVWANIYITPPGTQGFVRHKDKHDVMVLQISGRKDWLLYPDPEGEPVEIEMRPGDLLYVPKGLAHEARCSEYGSIHVTVGLLAVYGVRLLEELAEVAQDSVLFEQPVPLEFATDEARRAFDKDFAERVLALLAETPASTLVERRKREFADKQRTGWKGRFSDMLRLRELSGNTILCSRYEIERRVEDHGSAFEVHFAGTRTTVPRFLKACLDRILDDTPFPIREIPGLMTVDGKVEFVRPFVANGLLSIVRI